MSGSTETLYIGADITPLEAVQIFLEAASPDEKVEIATGANDQAGLDQVAWTMLPGIYIMSRVVLGIGLRFFKEEFGFFVPVWILFEMNYDAFRETKSLEEARADFEDYLIRGTLRFIEKHAFDVVLKMWNSDQTVLRRIDRKLSLNRRYDRWTPQRLKLVTLPYVLEDVE